MLGGLAFQLFALGFVAFVVAWISVQSRRGLPMWNNALLLFVAFVCVTAAGWLRDNYPTSAPAKPACPRVVKLT